MPREAVRCKRQRAGLPLPLFAVASVEGIEEGGDTYVLTHLD